MTLPSNPLKALFIGWCLLAALSPPALADDAQPLAAVTGEWSGPNKLWFLRPNKPLLSEGTAAVSADVFRYTWAYKGKPQNGELTLSGEPAALSATWTDTWHSPEPMTFQGTHEGGQIALLGSYSGMGKDWGWRIEIGPEGEQLVMRMYNITPKGKERPAVEFIADRPE